MIKLINIIQEIKLISAPKLFSKGRDGGWVEDLNKMEQFLKNKFPDEIIEIDQFLESHYFTAVIRNAEDIINSHSSEYINEIDKNFQEKLVRLFTRYKHDKTT